MFKWKYLSNRYVFISIDFLLEVKYRPRGETILIAATLLLGFLSTFLSRERKRLGGVVEARASRRRDIVHRQRKLRVYRRKAHLYSRVQYLLCVRVTQHQLLIRICNISNIHDALDPSAYVSAYLAMKVHFVRNASYLVQDDPRWSCHPLV